MLATSISEANKGVLECLKQSEDKKGVKKRGTYQKYSRGVKARIRNYAVVNGTSAAVHHFQHEFPNLKYSEWRNAVTARTQESHEMVTTLEEGKAINAT